MSFFVPLAKCLLFLTIFIRAQGGFEEKVHKLNHEDERDRRDCGLFVPPTLETDHRSKAHRAFVVFTLVLLGIIGFLLFLGIIKGIIGLCCAPFVGMWGLGILIDLPRPLDRYQENELISQPVVYDNIGWPIHPETKEKSVRALTKQTEFCLNVIFFLTYPLILLLDMCTMCCFASYDHDNEKKCFEGVNTVVFCNCSGKKKCYVGKTVMRRDQTMYEDDNDATEEQDTQYVLKMLQRSQDDIGHIWR